jgi:hypothetical protein
MHRCQSSNDRKGRSLNMCRKLVLAELDGWTALDIELGSRNSIMSGVHFIRILFSFTMKPLHVTRQSDRTCY